METIARQLEQAFRAAIRKALDLDADPLIGISQNEKFGDYQSNAAMGLAKQVAAKNGQKTNPRAVAEQIKGKLSLGEMAQEICIAGPGFINVKLSPTWLGRQLEQLGSDPRLGIAPTQSAKTVVVDYSGPNIAKQMHVGHLRSTIIGDAISRTLAFQGHNVIRQNHIGDWGTQFGRVVLAMWYAAMAEHFGEKPAFTKLMAEARRPETADQAVRNVANFHRNWILGDVNGEKFAEYLQNLRLDLTQLEELYVFVSALTEHPAAAEEWVSHPKHGRHLLAELPRFITTFIQDPSNPKNDQERTAWEESRRITLDTVSSVYRRLDVQLAQPELQTEPIIRGESFYYRDNRLVSVVAELLQKQIATRSEGAVVVEVPGFEAPLLIQKSDGSHLYGTTDLAALKFRLTELRAGEVIYTHDSRQSQHFAQVFWTARQAGWVAEATLEYAPFGTMLGEDGKPFKTRSGETVKLKDLLDESEVRAFAIVTAKNGELPEPQRREIAHAVGIGGVKYADLSKDRVSDYVFSWDRMLATDGNTAPYIQYAHARAQAILRKAASHGQPPLQLESPYELTIARQILRMGEVIELASRELKPHYLCAYLYELAAQFSGFFENCPVIQSPEPIRSSRLFLSSLIARTLEVGLELLGIEHPDEM